MATESVLTGVPVGPPSFPRRRSQTVGGVGAIPVRVPVGPSNPNGLPRLPTSSVSSEWVLRFLVVVHPSKVGSNPPSLHVFLVFSVVFFRRPGGD